MTPKAKSIAHGVAHFFVLSGTQGDIQFVLPFRLHFNGVDRWRLGIRCHTASCYLREDVRPP